VLNVKKCMCWCLSIIKILWFYTVSYFGDNTGVLA